MKITYGYIERFGQQRRGKIFFVNALNVQTQEAIEDMREKGNMRREAEFKRGTRG